MGRLSGADAEELALFGRRMEEAAKRLESIRSEVTAVVRQAQWDGEDAVYFRDLWQYRLSAMLQGAVVLTRNASAVAIRNADQQRTTSATDSGSVGPGGLGFGGGGRGPGSGPYGDPGAVKPWDPFDTPGKWLDRFSGAVDIVQGAGAWANKLGDASWLGRVGNGSVLHAMQGMTKSGWYAGLDSVGKAAGALGTVFDAASFGLALAGGDADKIKASGLDLGVGLAFTALQGAAIACPPAFIALGVAQIGYTFVPDEWKVALVDGVGQAGQDVWNAAVASTGAVVDAAGATADAVQDAAGAAVNAVQGVASGAADAVQDVGGAVSDIASGGFNSVRSRLGW
jgi:hypothetical protein